MVGNAKIKNGMVAQLDRVNQSPARQREKIEELQEEVDRLTVALQRYEQRYGRDLYPVEEESRKRRGEVLIDGKEVITLQEAASRSGVNYHTARRYCISGWWKHFRDDFGHYQVYVNQSLSRPPRKNAKTRQR